MLSRDLLQVVTVKIPPSTEYRELRLTLLEVRGGHRARLGFDADASIAIVRDELLNPTNGEPDNQPARIQRQES